MNLSIEVEEELIRKTFVMQYHSEALKWRGCCGEEAVEWWLDAATELERVGAYAEAEVFVGCAIIAEIGMKT